MDEHKQQELAAKHRRDMRNGNKHSKRGAAERGVVMLTAQQIKFIDEYMTDRDGPAAALRAGYARGKQAAYKLRSTPAIAAEITRREHERARRVDVSKDDIIRELRRIAFFDVRRLFNDDGTVRTNPYAMDDDEARALVNFDVIVLDRAGNYITALQPGNKLKALEMLGKSVGMFVDKKEVEQRAVKFSLDFGDEDAATDGGP